MTVETIEAPVEPRTKTVGDVLRHAARIIEERGWSDGDPVTEDGRFCAWGAIAAADGGLPNEYGVLPDFDEDSAAVRTFADWVHPDWFVPAGAVARWNDTPGRTAAEVIAALRAAADEADR